MTATAQEAAKARPLREGGLGLRGQLLNASFVMPALALMAAFLFYPIVYVVWLSFQKWNLLGSPKWIGIDNYTNILTGSMQSDFAHSLLVSTAFVILAMPAQVLLGLLLAILLERELKGRAFVRASSFFPMVISFVAAGVAFEWLLDPQLGYFTTLLQSIGITIPNWHHDPFWGIVVVVVMNTWKVAGFSMILYIAGLQGISNDLYEAAEIDGARTLWQRFRYISWPLLIPTTALLVITNTIGSFQAFVPFFVMTNGGPSGQTQTIVYFIFNTFTNRTGVACAAATLFLVLVLVITAVQLRVTRRSEQAIY